MTNTKLDITVSLTDLRDSLTRNVTQEELINFIENIDLNIKSVDFTINLVKGLVKSLESDIPRDQIIKMLQEG